MLSIPKCIGSTHMIAYQDTLSNLQFNVNEIVMNEEVIAIEIQVSKHRIHHDYS